MGSDPKKDKNATGDEQPQHAVHLPAYYIAKTPVTNAQYAAFVQATGHDPPGDWQQKQPPSDRQEHPVVKVSWHDAAAYCRWLAEKSGRTYRLPTEAEWEKAARGPEGLIYPWGNAWEAGRCNTEEDGKGGTTPVGAYPDGASPYGVLDMAGNVWEWTISLWGENWEKPAFGYPYDSADGREDVTAADKILRVVRGGSFFNDQFSARCAVRSRNLPYFRLSSNGFRIVVSPISSPSAP
jgi:formylglycine-generating enzyme required for sulfatase activity